MIKLLLCISLLTPIISSPPIIGLILILFTATITIIILLTYSTWVRIIIFIIYLGGLIVMFSYFISIRPNLPIFSPAITRFSYAFIYLSILHSNEEKRYQIVNSIQLSEIMSANLLQMLLLLLYVLFLMLIIIVLITKHTGRLRSFK